MSSEHHCTASKGESTLTTKALYRHLEKILTKSAKSVKGTSKGDSSLVTPLQAPNKIKPKQVSTTSIPASTLPVAVVYDKARNYHSFFPSPSNTTVLQTPPITQPSKRSQRRRIQRCDYSAPSKNYTFVAQYLATLELANKILHIYNDKGQQESLDLLLHVNMSKKWGQSFSNKLGRLAQGIKDVAGNDVIDFILIDEVPKDKKFTYTNMVCDYKPFKSDPYHIRLTVGRDKLDY